MTERTLDHASIRISSLEQSRTFYEEVLGLKTAPRPELGVAGVWYKLGQGQLHLIEASTRLEGIDPTGPHFAIRVEDLDAMRRRLQQAGIKMLDPGAGQLWIQDPDGNTVELCTARAPTE